jgi:SulP family sulfate permease
VVLAAFLFMHRMASTVEGGRPHARDEIEPAGDDTDMRSRLPPGVEAFRIIGPLFFGATSHLEDALRSFRDTGYPKVFILRTRLMPMVDASGVNTLEVFMAQLRKAGHPADPLRPAASSRPACWRACRRMPIPPTCTSRPTSTTH